MKLILEATLTYTNAIQLRRAALSNTAMSFACSFNKIVFFVRCNCSFLLSYFELSTCFFLCCNSLVFIPSCFFFFPSLFRLFSSPFLLFFVFFFLQLLVREQYVIAAANIIPPCALIFFQFLLFSPHSTFRLSCTLYNGDSQSSVLYIVRKKVKSYG